MDLSDGFRNAIELWADEAAERARRDPLPPIRVLVWGPTMEPSSNPEHRPLQLKRAQILHELRANGLTAATSEELALGPDDSPMPLHHIERQHVETADFIVLLLASPGSIAEFAGLLSSRSALRRSAVFCKEGAFDGAYVGESHLKNAKALGVVHAYTDAMLSSCEVASTAIAFALDAAESLRGSNA